MTPSARTTQSNSHAIASNSVSQQYINENIRPNPGNLKVTGQDKTSEFEDSDAHLTAEFGYKPVLNREFGYLSTFSFAVSISGLFATTMTTFSYPLSSGGASGVVWCWLISGAGCMCLAVSCQLLIQIAGWG